MLEVGEGKVREAVYVHLIGGQPVGGADGTVVSILHVRQVDVPVVLFFVADHRWHLSPGVIDALGAVVVVGVIGVCCDFWHAWTLLYTARDRLEQDCIPLPERRLAGHSQRVVHLTKISVVPSVVNSPAVTVYMPARRLNLSVKRRVLQFPRRESTLTATSGPDGKGRERMGQHTVCLEDFRAYY